VCHEPLFVKRSRNSPCRALYSSFPAAEFSFVSPVRLNYWECLSMAEIEAVCGRLAARRISETALGLLLKANAECQDAVEKGDADEYYRKNEQFHQIIYKQSGNEFLEHEALRLHRRLKPFRRIQLQLRGRMKQSLAEHKAIVQALNDSNPDRAANELRDHVAVQGEKFHLLMINTRTAAE